MLAAFMRDGSLAAHVRRIRCLCAERRAVLLATLGPTLPAGCAIQPSDQGMHVLLWLPERADDVTIAAELAAASLATRPVSTMYADPPGRPGLMLGFGGFPPGQLREAVKQLVHVLHGALHPVG